MRNRLAQTISIKPEELVARSYVDRLILEQLTEMESAVKLGDLADRLSKEGVGLATVRSLLASNPERFAYHERRWVPAARLLGQGRPFNEVLVVVLRSFGGPVQLELLIQEIGRIRRSTPEEVEPIIRRVLDTDRRFVLTSKNLVALTELGFNATDERLERALALNSVNTEEFEAAQKKLAKSDWRAPDAIPEALKVAAPIKLKVLGAVAFSALNPQDPRAVLLYDSRSFLARVLDTEGYVLGGDGTLHVIADAKKWVTTAVKLAERIAPTIDVEDAAPIEVKAEDVKRLVARVTQEKAASTTTTKLLEEFYEITPSNKTFPDDMTNMMAAMRGDSNVQWVGGDRLRKAGTVPEFIHTVPEPFHFVRTEFRNEEGDLVDVELTDDGLSSTLRKLLAHPLATDVLDEDVLPPPKTMPETLRLVIKSIHRELGTFPMCQIPTGWLDADPKIQELIWVDPTGREQQVWLNQDTRLIYDLVDWWYEQPIESGAVFTLTKTPRPNVFEFAWLDQPDPVIYVSSQRMEELRNMGVDADAKSTLQILIDVMGHWPKGADYLTLLAEVNVVRRSTRRLVASILSSYQCFYQRSGSPVWHFDPKKVDLGFDKTKKKFIKK
ncbi:MAG: hypothetical protein QOJ65_1932 [Fimbriimonadaceae bacterium]|jgi:hypothetical protein|nr:hypothetical protein [Fimbriimonadaceae bacterium]